MAWKLRQLPENSRTTRLRQVIQQSFAYGSKRRKTGLRSWASARFYGQRLCPLLLLELTQQILHCLKRQALAGLGDTHMRTRSLTARWLEIWDVHRALDSAGPRARRMLPCLQLHGLLEVVVVLVVGRGRRAGPGRGLVLVVALVLVVVVVVMVVLAACASCWSWSSWSPLSSLSSRR